MRADLRRIAASLSCGAAIFSAGFAAFAIYRLRDFERRLRAAPGDDARAYAPPVTILKPARGAEPDLEENLASFCRQEYPDFEVLFGVLDPNDAALPAIERVVERFPEHARVGTGDGVARYRNPKISALQPVIAGAQGEILIVADSDMRVTPEYLRAVVAPFADPRAGAVTCLFGGEPAAPDLASTLGAMGITEQFMPSTMVANAVEPMTYCFGSTVAVRRSIFEAFGGFDALGERLADDHAVGSLVVEHGYRVAVAAYVVTNVVAEAGIRELFAHELRWLRTIRSVRAASYPGIGLTYPVPLALLHLAVARRRGPALAVLALAIALRALLQRQAHATFRTRNRPPVWLTPLRDLLGIAAWAAGFGGRTVRWRGTELTVKT